MALRLPPANFSYRFAVKHTNHYYVLNITNLAVDSTHAHDLSLNRFLNEPELLTALSRILMVDGELHEKERQHITGLAERRGVPESRLKTIFATATSNDIPINVPQDRQQANAFMDHLLRAALVDGTVTRSEQDLLLQAGSQIGWSAADLKIALGRTRSELFQQAKKIIRERRRE